jgi:hypothetical protein
MAEHKNYPILKIQTIATIVAFLGSYFFGSIANAIWKNDLMCGTIGDIGGCSNTFVVIFGFYLGLFFCISAAHFGFIRKTALYYWITIGLLLLSSLILIDLFYLAFGYIVAGILAGQAVYFRKQRRA